MRTIRTLSFPLLAVFALSAQTPAPEVTAAQQPDLQALTTAVRALRRTSKASDEVKAQADKLIADAQSGQNGESRRRLANAWTLLKGEQWDAKQEFAWSLALRPNETVADSSMPLIVRLTQT